MHRGVHMGVVPPRILHDGSLIAIIPIICYRNTNMKEVQKPQWQESDFVVCKHQGEKKSALLICMVF